MVELRANKVIVASDSQNFPTSEVLHLHLPLDDFVIYFLWPSTPLALATSSSEDWSRQNLETCLATTEKYKTPLDKIENCPPSYQGSSWTKCEIQHRFFNMADILNCCIFSSSQLKTCSMEEFSKNLMLIKANNYAVVIQNVRHIASVLLSPSMIRPVMTRMIKKDQSSNFENFIKSNAWMLTKQTNPTD